MNLLNLEHVSKVFVTKKILDDVTVGISDGDKIGVVGVNGTGKSTLLQVLAGELEPDQGQVTRGNAVRISYLAQNPDFDGSRTLLENVVTRISGREDHWDLTGEVRARLADFGIPDAEVLPDSLSGGQKRRAALIAAILTPCDLLILDEPTNHLDYAMVEWLQDYLKKFRGAVLMVTHDRYFLDEVTNQILELDGGRAFRYQSGYSGYLELRQQRMDYALAAERKMAALYKQDLAWMMRGARARSTKQKAHIQRFEMLRDRERIREERQAALSSLPSRLGGRTIELIGVRKSFGEKLLFRDFSYLFGKTDRIGLIGGNGCGKSTLIKCIVGEESVDEGSVEIGQTVRIGYFSQDKAEMDPDQRVIDYVKDTAEFIQTPDGLVSASSMCERFLFDGDMQYSPIGKLSGGEKRRLSLLKALMDAPNVLILDEPTNDLDIQTLQILEDYLDGFAGILIVVSHDRYFLDRVVTRVFSFEEDGSLYRSEGGYTDWVLHRREEGLPDGIGTAAGGGSKGAEDPARRQSSMEGWKGAKRKQNRLSYKDQREYDGIEEEIAGLEERLARLEEEMAASATDYVRLAELNAERTEADERLEERMERFLELQDLVESFDR